MQRASVDIQGVPTLGEFDSGADIKNWWITLQESCQGSKGEEERLQEPDRTSRPYNKHLFVVHGCIDLDITFDGKTMSTPVYIKIDSYTPLLQCTFRRDLPPIRNSDLSSFY